ncbi:GAF domain-containing protein [bacterium]|nr:GAF domain-containing protein [bacterium]
MPDDANAPEDPRAMRKELERYRLVVGELQGKIKELEEELSTAATMAEMPMVVVTRPELRKTLSRLINKVAMIVQAEKVMIMLYQAEAGELVVLPPAMGVTEEQATELHVTPEQGVSGLVYRTGESAIYNDALNDPRTLDSEVSLLRIRNGIVVPLTIKQRDEEERIIDERIIGVLHVLNKRYEQQFNEDDVRLLEMLADQAAAVISNAQLYIELTEEKQQLEDTFESIHAGMIVVTTKGRIRLINPAACAMLHLPANDYQGKLLSDVVNNESVLGMLSNLDQAQRGDSREIGIEEDKRIYKAEATAIAGDNGEVQSIVAIFNDITELRQVERMKTAFVSTVSHELRTPLTSIKGFVATLLDDKDGTLYDEETRYEFYTIIDQECDRLTRLISDLLNVSRIESGRALDMQISEVNINELASRVLGQQQSYTDRHQLVCEVPADMPPIEADADKIQQILDNLVGNAIKYSPNGGTVSISAEDEGDKVRIDIRDQGLGVPDRHREKIFDRFHMVDDDVDHKAIKGTGIGLYLVRHLARAHGGDVWLSWSEVGKGSCFSVRLPKVQQAQKDIEQV